jgi:adenosine deaminase
VTINTDNRLITDTTVTTELERAVETFDLDIWQVRQLILNGFKSAFLPFHERQALLRRISEQLDQLIDDELRAQGYVVQVPTRTATDGSKRSYPVAV